MEEGICIEKKDDCVKDAWERCHAVGEPSMCEWLRVAAKEMGNG